MTAYSVAEAANAFPALIDKVMAGEEVVITRDGAPVVTLKSVTPTKTNERTAALDAVFSQQIVLKSMHLSSVDLLNMVYDEPES